MFDFLFGGSNSSFDIFQVRHHHAGTSAIQSLKDGEWGEEVGYYADDAERRHTNQLRSVGFENARDFAYRARHHRRNPGIHLPYGICGEYLAVEGFIFKIDQIKDFRINYISDYGELRIKATKFKRTVLPKPDDLEELHKFLLVNLYGHSKSEADRAASSHRAMCENDDDGDGHRLLPGQSWESTQRG